MTKDKWEFYKDKKGEWRWRRTASNGKIVGTSSEGYKNRKDCYKNAIRNGYSTIDVMKPFSIVFLLILTTATVLMWVLLS